MSFLLTREADFEPVSLVMGSSIYHVGWQSPGLRESVELTTMTQAMYHARELAMTRMEEEADTVGADGVIGVRLLISMSDWGENLAEFMAIGTAVRSRTNAGEFRAPSGRPFTSDLSGAGFLETASGRLPPRVTCDGNVRVSRRLSGCKTMVLANRQKRRNADLHAGRL